VDAAASNGGFADVSRPPAASSFVYGSCGNYHGVLMKP
jgi:hypothetical protein